VRANEWVSNRNASQSTVGSAASYVPPLGSPLSRRSPVRLRRRGPGILSSAGANLSLKTGIAKESDHGPVERVIERFLIVLSRSGIAVVLRRALDPVLPASAAAFSD
jgi:hypothetical protein